MKMACRAKFGMRAVGCRSRPQVLPKGSRSNSVVSTPVVFIQQKLEQAIES